MVISGNLPKDGGKYSLYAAIIVKRVDAQTRAKTSAERPAARLSFHPINEELTYGNHQPTRHDGAHLALDEREEGIGRLPVGPFAGADQDQRPVRADQQPVLAADAPKNLLAEVLPPERMAELERDGELNIGFPLAGVGRFRVSAMRQRGSLAAVIRFIAVDVPPLATLSVPHVLGDLIMEKRGLLLMVGATGAGKSTTLASMIDYRNETGLGPHPDD